MGQLILLFSLAVVIGLVWSLWHLAHKQPAAEPSVDFSDLDHRTELVGRDTTGSVRWTHRFPAEVATYSTIHDGGGEYYLVLGEGIGQRLRSIIRQGKMRAGLIAFAEFENPALDDHILSLDPATGVRWERTYRDVIGPLARRFPHGWTQQSHLQFSVGESRKTVLLFQHKSGWPAVIVALDDSGAVLGRFAHAGTLTGLGLEDITPATWARLFLVAQGTSASRKAAVLAVLDALAISGSSPEDAGSTYQCSECGPAGTGLRYYEFPRTEVEIAGSLPLPTLSGTSYDNYGNGFFYWFTAEYGVSYYFSEDFERVRIELEDDYWRRHRELESAGRIAHSQDRCPERNGPPSIRAWSAAAGWRDLVLEH